MYKKKKKKKRIGTMQTWMQIGWCAACLALLDLEDGRRRKLVMLTG
jgi:hypothetical protein